MKRIPQIAVLVIFSAFLFYSLQVNSPAPQKARDYLLHKGPEETGAINLVTSIYLGYRAFDTLGETIVLLVSVSGVVYFIGKKQ